MSEKSLGTLFAASRLIAKSINRLIVEPDFVDLSSWKSEGKLLCSPIGDCLSSTTLLVKNAYVPTYGFDGRCYGILLDAEKCNIYDVNLCDANTNRTDKLEKRKTRRGINFYTTNELGLMTLDDLSNNLKNHGESWGQVNEVLLDAKKEACRGLFVRFIDISKAKREVMKHYFLTLLETKLTQKYLIQVFGFPENLNICLYDEKEGKLLTYPSFNEVLNTAFGLGINAKTYPKLFSLLSDDFNFPPLHPPITVRDYLQQHEENCSPPFREKILLQLSQSFVTLDGNKVSPQEIAQLAVDDIEGVANTLIDDIIQALQQPSNKTMGIENVTWGFAQPLLTGCESPMDIEENIEKKLIPAF